jgi:hypothetical protein
LNSAPEPDKSGPLGATVSGDEVNFSLFSREASSLSLPRFFAKVSWWFDRS